MLTVNNYENNDFQANLSLMILICQIVSRFLQLALRKKKNNNYVRSVFAIFSLKISINFTHYDLLAFILI